MLELIINEVQGNKTVALLENGKLVEIYEELKEDRRNEGNIYLGIVKDILPGMQSAFVDIGTEKNSFINVKDILPHVDQKSIESSKINEQDIKKVVNKNDKILVQIKKDSNEQKGARISSHISIESRFIILMPNTSIITISQKIEDENEKERLLEIVRNELPENTGAIIRTAAQNKDDKQIKQDVKNVLRQWTDIQEKFNKEKVLKPKILYKSPNIEEKIIIDMADKKLESIIVNNKEEQKIVENILKVFGLENKIKVTETKESLYIQQIEEQKEKIHNRKIWLASGAFITIDKTEALTAIDVNTGKFTGKINLEDTVYRVNYEATIEIARQLRLRDIGGIIIIDYIDMNNIENKTKIEELLKEQLKNDRAKTQVEGFTKLDLMELTRKHISSYK